MKKIIKKVMEFYATKRMEIPGTVMSSRLEQLEHQYTGSEGIIQSETEVPSTDKRPHQLTNG